MITRKRICIHELDTFQKKNNDVSVADFCDHTEIFTGCISFPKRTEKLRDLEHTLVWEIKEKVPSWTEAIHYESRLPAI